MMHAKIARAGDGAFIGLILFLSATVSLHAATDAELRKIQFDQNLGRTVSLNTSFTDETGRLVTLGEYVRGTKPVVLVPGYYGCPMLCTVVANGLIESLQELKMDVGRDFDVVHFSVDPREGPAEATAKKQTYVKRYGRTGAAAGWHFLTSSDDSIRRLADEIGFRYFYDEASRQYAHPSGFVILTPQGKISRYFFGVNFAPAEMRAALMEAGQNRAGSRIAQLFLLCFHYNPITGKYSFTIMTALRICGVVTLLALCFFIGNAVRRSRAHAMDF